MSNPGMPTPDLPGEVPPGTGPDEVPPLPAPDEAPDTGPTGPRTPYPVNDPGIGEPAGPGSEPDYMPGAPSDPGVRM